MASLSRALLPVALLVDGAVLGWLLVLLPGVPLRWLALSSTMLVAWLARRAWRGNARLAAVLATAGHAGLAASAAAWVCAPGAVPGGALLFGLALLAHAAAVVAEGRQRCPQRR